MYLGTVILAGHEPARAELPDSPQGLPDQSTASVPRAANTHSEEDSRIGERYAWLSTLLGYRKEAVAALRAQCADLRKYLPLDTRVPYLEPQSFRTSGA